jgi:predicted 3-demethylubiquinone-9 3-methyltransferase (glyoxalase superfamily)
VPDGDHTFNNNADEAIALYTSVFSDARVLSAQRGPDGKLFTATIELRGQRLMLLNGGPMFTFTEAISLFVDCDTQAEIDELWTRLIEGGGWITYGGLDQSYLSAGYSVTWQSSTGSALIHSRSCAVCSIDSSEFSAGGFLPVSIGTNRAAPLLGNEYNWVLRPTFWRPL